MKVKKPPMPFFQIIFYVLSFFFLIGAFIYLGTKNYNVPKKRLSDAESFTQEYGISNENPFRYKTASEILETLNTGTAMIFMAFPENEWSRFYADLLNDVAKEEQIKEIRYYNFLKDRKNNNHYYENIVDYFRRYTYILDDSTKNLYAPTFVIIKNGEVLYFDNETAIMSGDYSVDEYWTFEKKQEKKKELKEVFQMYKGWME